MNDSSMSAKTAGCLPGKYLNFGLGSEFYGVELSKVKEIIGMMRVTRVPNSPRFVRGVINLRGKVISVIDLRMKFGLQTNEDTERTCIIVMQIDHQGQLATMGVIVDEVCEVLDIPGDQLEPAPEMGMHATTDMLMGVGKAANKVILLLDVEKVLLMNPSEAHETPAEETC